MTDYIEREAAIKRFNFAVLDFLGMEPTIRAGDIITALESIPAADVRSVVRAEFVRCGDGKGVPYMCSHCGRTTPANMVEIWGVNYCPNCGADMREEQT